jgi:putative transposase
MRNALQRPVAKMAGLATADHRRRDFELSKATQAGQRGDDRRHVTDLIFDQVTGFRARVGDQLLAVAVIQLLRHRKRLVGRPTRAVEVEFDTFLASNSDLALPDGRQRVVRHGHDPVRTIQTGIGPVKVQKPKARDRGAPQAGERIRFTSSILPKWARRTKSLDALLPALYLRGISAGDFQEVLTVLLGKDAPNLSPAVIARLKGEWEDEYQRWQKRDLSARRYVYVWADGVYLQARMEPQAECMLVLIGATPEGKKELIGFQTGMRESVQSWKELLVDLKARGLSIAPEVAVGDGALGFWKALDEAFPSTRHQRCWLHKTLNVLDKFPKSVQPNAHKDLHEIWLAPDRATAETAIAAFAEKYAPKYDKAVECLIKDRETLLTFFDFPADHWDHLRTTNPIESVFATVRHRTVRMKGALSQDTARLMVFKLVMAASKTWRRLQGQNQLPKVIQGVKFQDGIEVAPEAKSAA